MNGSSSTTRRLSPPPLGSATAPGPVSGSVGASRHPAASRRPSRALPSSRSASSPGHRHSTARGGAARVTGCETFPPTRGTMGRASAGQKRRREGDTMPVLDSFLDAMGEHAPGSPALRGPRRQAHDPRQAGDAEPGQLREGPDRAEDDRGGRARGAPQARRDDRRADVRQHGPRARDRRGGSRVPVHLRDAGQDEPGEDLAAPRVRGGGRDLPHGRRARVPGELLPRGRPAGGGDPWCVPAEPVPQPGEPSDPLRHDRSGDLGADGGPAHGLRLRRGDRRHDLRRRAAT